MLPRRDMLSGVNPNPIPGLSEGYTDRSYNATYEEYRTLQSRLDTFRNWPSNLYQRPEEMAEAGWCYTGQDDGCFCFACGGSLMEWQQEDNPWIEHCKFRNCPHLREFKGDEYISRYHQTTDHPAANTATNQVAFDDTTVEWPVFNHKAHTQSDVEVRQHMNISNIRLPDPALLPQGDEPNIEQTQHIPTCLNAQEVNYDELTNRIHQRTDHTDIIRASHDDGNDTDVLFDANIQDVLEEPSIQQERDSDGIWSHFMCHLCKINLVNALFIPCRHLMYCMGCTRHYNWCPDCNIPIVERIQTYMTR